MLLSFYEHSYISAQQDLEYTTKRITAPLPSVLKNQAIRDARCVWKKYCKTGKQSVLRKPVAIWNNQSYNVGDNSIAFPIFANGKTSRINVRAVKTEYQQNLLYQKQGSLRITFKSGKCMAQIAVDAQPDPPVKSGTVMGIDLGIKIPAVAVTNGSKTKFFGNGRQNKFIRRKHKSARRKLGKLKKLEAIRKRHDKEQRWMKDQDHKISRQIINFAKDNFVSKICLEQLANIRYTARTSRKNEKNLHIWSFYRLSRFIEYKAMLAGIEVVYVNPCYTSQKCPTCYTLNKARDRKYYCSCGFKTHRDRLGAINIISAPVADGKSLSA